MKSRFGLLLAFVTAGVLLAPRAGRAEEMSILNGSVAVQAVSYQYFTVPVDVGVMRDAAITGHVQSAGGMGNDIEVTVFSESDFLNWKNGHATSPLYNSGRVTAADVDARITQSGTYYVVLSNTFSLFTPKTVGGSLRLTWTAPSPFAAATENPGTLVMPLLAALVAFLAVIGGWYLWASARRRGKAAAVKGATSAPTPAPAVQGPGAGSFCTHCGSPVTDEARFCAGCGKAVAPGKAA